jgi:hypothetical protein
MSDFLPKEYKPKGRGQFMKLEAGENKIRILEKALPGFIWWKNKKPNRVLKEEDVTKGAENVKTFWLLKVWDYKTEQVAVLEITQSTIIGSMFEYYATDEYGDMRNYDVKINKEGSGKQTRYSVVAMPPKEMEGYIKEASDNSDITYNYLEGLVNGQKDSFEGIDLDEEPDLSKEESQEQVDLDDDDLPF